VTVLLLAATVVATLGSAQNAAPPPGAQRSSDYITFEQLRFRDRFESDGSFERTQEVKVTLRDAAAVAAFGQIGMSYLDGFGEVHFDGVAIEKPGGTRVNVDDALVEDVNPYGVTSASMSADVRFKKLTIPGLEPGDRLSYRIVTRQKPLAPGRVFGEMKFQPTISDPLQSYELDLPNDPGIAVHLRKDLGVEWEEVRGPSDRRVRRLSVRPKSPDYGRDGPTEAETEALGRPDVVFTNFRSWSDLTEWWWGLSKTRLSPDAAVRGEAARIVKGQATPRQSIDALYAFVASRVRYLSVGFGVGRMQPRPAGEVLSSKYGDCKDKLSLLAALGGALGIDIRPALVSSVHKALQDDVPSPLQFDHMIGVARLGPEPRDWVWLDATNDLAVPGYLLPALRDKPALLIEDSGKARVVQTPADAPFPQRVEVEVNGSLDATGPLRAHVRWTVRSDAEILLRNSYNLTPRDRYVEFTSRSLASTWSDGKVTNVTTSDPSDTREPFRVDFDVERVLVDRCSDKGWSLWLPFPDPLLPWPRKYGSPTEKAAEFMLNELVWRAEIKLPDGLSATAPSAVSLDRPFARYRSEYSAQEARIGLSRHLTISKRSVTGSEVPSYDSFRQEIEKDRLKDFQVSPTRGATPNRNAPAKAGAALDIASVLDEMAERADDFDPHPLLERGRQGMADLLAELLPESAMADASRLAAGVNALIPRLGDGRCRVRESVTRKLIALGPAAQEPLQATARRRDDGELALRARAVLDQIQEAASSGKSSSSPQDKPTAEYGPAFAVYLAGVTDPGALQELALRTAASVAAGRERTSSGFDLVEQAIRAVVATRNDALIDLMKPLLAAEPEERAAWAVGAIGANRPSGFVPALLREAARSSRPLVARAADLWLRELGDATPFSASSMRSSFMLRGTFEAVYERVGEHLLIDVLEGDIVRAETKYKGREAFDHLRVGLARNTGENNAWNVERRSNRLPIRRIVAVGDHVVLPRVRFVIPRNDINDLTSYWVVFETEARTIDNEGRGSGTTYAHSDPSRWATPTCTIAGGRSTSTKGTTSRRRPSWTAPSPSIRTMSRPAGRMGRP
jgi:transglutaminase-like putative cysteine protease